MAAVVDDEQVALLLQPRPDKADIKPLTDFQRYNSVGIPVENGDGPGFFGNAVDGAAGPAQPLQLLPGHIVPIAQQLPLGGLAQSAESGIGGVQTRQIALGADGDIHREASAAGR